MNQRLYLILICCFLFSTLTAQEEKWVTTVGSSHGANITPEEGKRLALEAAQTEAIRQVVGIEINDVTYRKLSETIVGHEKRLSDIFERLSRTNSYGKITDVDILEEWTVIENNLPVYKIRIKALVQEEIGKADPNFSVEIIMPRDVYYTDGNNGEELNFKIRATKNCYVYLFNFMANDSVQVLMPNKFITNNSYYPDREMQAYEQMFQNISFKVMLPRNTSNTVETLFVVATKEKFNFNNGDFDSNSEGTIPTQIAVMDINKSIIKIPRDSRTEAFIHYEIRKR